MKWMDDLDEEMKEWNGMDKENGTNPSGADNGDGFIIGSHSIPYPWLPGSWRAKTSPIGRTPRDRSGGVKGCAR